MTVPAELLTNLLKEIWTALVTSILLLSLVGFLVMVLRAAGSAFLGSRFGFAGAISSIAGMFFILLFAFLGLPALLETVQSASVVTGLCDPLFELGAAAAAIVGGLAAVRMLIGPVAIYFLGTC